MFQGGILETCTALPEFLKSVALPAAEACSYQWIDVNVQRASIRRMDYPPSRYSSCLYPAASVRLLSAQLAN